MLYPVYYEGCSASELIDSLKCECGLTQMCFIEDTVKMFTGMYWDNYAHTFDLFGHFNMFNGNTCPS